MFTLKGADWEVIVKDNRAQYAAMDAQVKLQERDGREYDKLVVAGTQRR